VRGQLPMLPNAACRRRDGLVLRADRVEERRAAVGFRRVSVRLVLDEVLIRLSKHRASVDVHCTVLAGLSVNDGRQGAGNDDAARVVHQPLLCFGREMVPEFLDVHNNQHCPSLVGEIIERAISAGAIPAWSGAGSFSLRPRSPI